MIIKTPIIEISPHWPTQAFEVYDKASKRLKILSQSSGKRGDAFKEAYYRLRNIVMNEGRGSIHKHITKRIEVRAMLHLLINDQDVAEKIEIDTALCNSFLVATPVFSTLTLLSAIQCYFYHFSDISKGKGLGALIKSQLSILEDKIRDNELVKLNQNKELIFDSSGPQKIVRVATEHQMKFTDFIKTMGFFNYDNTQYVKQCRGIYYLNNLRALPKDTKSSLLAEIQVPEVFEAPYDYGRMIGHETIVIILEKFKDETLISDNWMEIILKIAGDPRVPESSSQYQRWWTKFSQDQIDQILAALSGFDLDLFLTALKDYADKSSDPDLKRMFIAREKFLRGLLEQNLIKKSRMFLGREAEAYIKRNYDKEKRPNFSFLREKSKSIIYLDLGFCKIIEGSHICKFRIFDKLPLHNKIHNYNEKYFSYRELTAGIDQDYNVYRNKQNNKWGSKNYPIAITHSPPIGWQAQVIQSINRLASNKLMPELMFSQKDYGIYKRRYFRIDATNQRPSKQQNHQNDNRQLSDDILIYLKKNPHSFSREIAKALNYPKKEINQNLSFVLKNKVVRSSHFRWSLK